jgi:molybdate transport system substrate-binding protein
VTTRISPLAGLLLLASTWLAGPCDAQERKPAQVLVFAAASLTDVLGELSTTWRRKSGVTVKLSFAASSVLARQIEAGVAAEIFVSADQQWMDYLAVRRFIDADSRRDLAGNRLVLIAPADSTLQLAIAPGFDLETALAGGRLSTADPDTVPAGRYAHMALASLGVWPQIADRLVRAENVRSALNFVARGEAPLGIVYSTDAQIDPKVRVVATFPDHTHQPITYPAAATAKAGPQAAAFLSFLSGAEAAAVWKKYGFRELSK